MKPIHMSVFWLAATLIALVADWSDISVYSALVIANVWLAVASVNQAKDG